MQTQTSRLRPTKNGRPVRGWRTIPSQGAYVTITGIQYTNGVLRGTTTIAAPHDNLLIETGAKIDPLIIHRWANDNREQIAVAVGQNAVRSQPWAVLNVLPPDADHPNWTYHLIPLTYACIDRSLWALPREGLFVSDVPLLKVEREGENGKRLDIAVEYDEDRPCPPLEAWLPWLQAYFKVNPNRWEINPIEKRPGLITFICRHFSQFTVDRNPVVGYARSHSGSQIIHTVTFARPLSKEEWETFVETRAFYYGYHPAGYGPAQWKPQDPDSLDAEGKTCTWVYTHWSSCD